MQPGLREEMTRLAASYPGLRNERAQELVRGTADLDDRSLVRDIRKRAAEITRSSDQGSPDVQSQVEVMENRVRLGARASGTGAAASGLEGKGLPQTATSHAPSPASVPSLKFLSMQEATCFLGSVARQGGGDGMGCCSSDRVGRC